MLPLSGLPSMYATLFTSLTQDQKDTSSLDSLQVHVPSCSIDLYKSMVVATQICGNNQLVIL